MCYTSIDFKEASCLKSTATPVTLKYFPSDSKLLSVVERMHICSRHDSRRVMNPFRLGLIQSLLKLIKELPLTQWALVQAHIERGNSGRKEEHNRHTQVQLLRDYMSQGLHLC